MSITIPSVPYTLQTTTFTGPQIYYVSPTGNNSNNGLSSAKPWKTITKVNASSFNPGDHILFQGGQTFTGAIVCPSAGTPSAPIVFGSYGNGRATISSGTSTGFSSTNQSGITIRDLIFTGTSSTNNGIIFATLDSNVYTNIAIINCTISAYGYNGIYIVTGGVSTGNYQDVLVQGTTVHHCADQNTSDGNHNNGININAQGTGHVNVQVLGCVVHHCPGGAGTGGGGNGIGLFVVTNGLIANCLVHDNGSSANLGGSGPSGIVVIYSTNVVVANCEVYSQSTANGIDGNGIDIDGACSNCSMVDCYTHDNFGAGLMLFNFSGQTWDRNSIINCVSVNDGAGGAGAANPTGIYVARGASTDVMTNAVVSGCSVYQSQANTDVVRIGSAGGNSNLNVKIVGNTFNATSATSIFCPNNPTNVVFSGNRYYANATGSNISWNGTAYTSIADWNAATGQEASGVFPQRFLSPLNVGPAQYSTVLLDSAPGIIQSVSNTITQGWQQTLFGTGNHNSGTSLVFAKTRATSPSTSTALQSGDGIGGIVAFGADGSGYVPVGFASYTVDGSVSAGVVPAGFVINTGSGGYGTEHFRVSSLGSTIAGGSGSALNTTATDGFLYIPTCAGPPTGTPTSFTGRVAMVYDTSNNKFYIYNGGWKGGTNPGTFT